MIDDEIPATESDEVQAYVRGYLQGARSWGAAAELAGVDTLPEYALRNAHRVYGVACPSCNTVWVKSPRDFPAAGTDDADGFGYTCPDCEQSFWIELHYGSVQAISPMADSPDDHE